jgi:glycerate 2-kinase
LTDSDTGRRHRAVDIFSAGLRAADPYSAVLRHINAVRRAYDVGEYSEMYIVSVGKASVGMARGALESLGGRVRAGVVITKRNGSSSHLDDGRIVTYEAGHPVPDSTGVRATEHVIRLVRPLDRHSFVLVLISGGASALLVAPHPSVTLDDVMITTRLLLDAGADIGQLNTVRKHISSVKGGRLASAIFPATTYSLILSDVIGDRLDVIGSGPTSPDETTYEEALEVLDVFRIVDKVPLVVRDLLLAGKEGGIPETPKPDDPLFGLVTNTIIGSNIQAVDACRSRAAQLGYQSRALSTTVQGEARDAGRWLAREVKEARSRGIGKQRGLCLVSGGETTVTVAGNGIGGRNMELALAFALEIEGEEGITLLSAGTDGGDGPTDAAGAIVDGRTIVEARRAGIDPETALRKNDSYVVFDKTGGLVRTGPTGTNVMDLQIVLIDGK